MFPTQHIAKSVTHHVVCQTIKHSKKESSLLLHNPKVVRLLTESFHPQSQLFHLIINNHLTESERTDVLSGTGVAVKQCLGRKNESGHLPGFLGGTLIPVGMRQTCREFHAAICKHRLHANIY